MRKFKDIIFFGMGEYSEEITKLLKKRLQDGIDISSGLQQPPHSIDEQTALENKVYSDKLIEELNDIIKDIAMALTGKNIEFK